MVIILKLFGGLQEFLPNRTNPHSVELDEGADVVDVLKIFGVPKEKPRVLLVNGRHVELDYVLQDGDVLAVFPPVAGG